MTRESPAPETCLSLIEGAATDASGMRSLFSHRYLPAVRAYLTARWRGTDRIEQLDDAVQTVFLECFRERGALCSFDARHGGGFRAFLFGVVRNVALCFERDGARGRRREVAIGSAHLRTVPDSEDSLSTVFDRCYAQSLMTMAKERMLDSADGDAKARRRYELLRLRFEEELPIREIARRWGEDAARLHREYRAARHEFRRCLEQVVAYHLTPSSDASTEAERLFALLSR